MLRGRGIDAKTITAQNICIGRIADEQGPMGTKPGNMSGNPFKIGALWLLMTDAFGIENIFKKTI